MAVQLPQIQRGAGSAAAHRSETPPTEALKSSPRESPPPSWKRSNSSTRRSFRGWQKVHPLEGDGLLSNLYNHLWRKDKNFQCCQVRIPDTVVYEHNFPRGWYSYDPKSNELVKKIGKDLDTSSIYSHFSKLPRAHSDDVDVCCQFICSNVDPTDPSNTVTSVEFFTPSDLFHFLNERKQRPDGILQKFLMPKSKGNSQIQAVWSPRVCIVQRRENRSPLTDKYVLPCERYVTFDGPTHLTEDGFCAPKTKEQIKSTCENIVHHFAATEHKIISRMVLYFKVDQYDNIWLLWASSLRVASSRHHPAQRMPLNLSPEFVSPSISEKNDQQLHEWDNTLLAMDLKQYTLSHDIIFAKSICSGGMPRGSSPRIATNEMKQYSPRSKDFYLSTVQRKGKPLSPVKKKEPDALSSPRPQRLTSPRATSITSGSSEPAWYHTHPAVTRRYHEIMTEIGIVDHAVQDFLYTIYSHFLKSTSTLLLSPPDDLLLRISKQSLNNLMGAFNCVPAKDPEDPEPRGPVYRVSYHSKLPMSQMNENAKAFVLQMKANKLGRLKNDIDAVIAGGGADIMIPTPPTSRPTSQHVPRPPATKKESGKSTPKKAGTPPTPNSQTKNKEQNKNPNNPNQTNNTNNNNEQSLPAQPPAPEAANQANNTAAENQGSKVEAGETTDKQEQVSQKEPQSSQNEPPSEKVETTTPGGMTPKPAPTTQQPTVVDAGAEQVETNKPVTPPQEGGGD